MKSPSEEHERAYIRNFMVKVGIPTLIIFPLVLTVLDLEPTLRGTAAVFAFRFLVFGVFYLPCNTGF